ncbi:Methyltransferase-like protein 22 [Chamberlinius hualienensis]
MDEDDLVLSDLHIEASQISCSSLTYKSSTKTHQIKVTQSRFCYLEPELTSEDIPATTFKRENLNYDDDGDVDVLRKIQKFEVIILDHSLASPLSLVGLQLWSGALILSDYLLHNRHGLKDKIVLELGAGSGLTSIVASKYAKLVLCTDMKDDILQLCRRNVDRNSSVRNVNNVIVKELDWSHSNIFEKDSGECWSWTKKDLEHLKEVDLIIASDVVYSDELTDHFLNVLLTFLRGNRRPINVFISLERRLNFTLDNLEVSCPAYDHFIECIKKFESDVELPQLTISQISTDFTQYFSYKRTKYLEIWKLSNVPEIID